MRRRAAGAPLLLTMVMIPGKYEKSMTKRRFFFELFRNSLKTAPFAESERRCFYEGSFWDPDRMAAMSSAAVLRSRRTPENSPIWARF